MKIPPLLTKLQTFLGVTANELAAVLVILLGLCLGAGYSLFVSGDEKDYSRMQELQRIIDSLAEVQKSTYIGSDMQGRPDSNLAKGDTIVEKESYYPKSKKKELPKSAMNINTASKVQLTKLPGVGNVTAVKIIEYRKKSPFKRPSDIKKVKGIGPKKFEKMKPYIVVK